LGDPAYQETQCVDGCFIRPVDVLNDDGAGRRLAQLIEQRVHNLVALTGLQRLREPGTDRRCKITEWAQRPGRTQCVAGANQHPRPVGEFWADRWHQARFADARLAVQ
jgi:hypothetical protein